MKRLRPLVAPLIALAGLISGASAEARPPDPVPCSVSAGKTMCEFYRSGDGFSAGAPVVGGDGRRIGFLKRGPHRIVCQERGVTVRDGAGNRNHWFGWTPTQDLLRAGWASAIDARGGTDFGRFSRVPPCRGRHGDAPRSSAAWRTADSRRLTMLRPGAPSLLPMAPTSRVGIGGALGGTRLPVYRPGAHLEMTRRGNRAGLCTGSFVLRDPRGRQRMLTSGQCTNGTVGAGWRALRGVGGGLVTFGDVAVGGGSTLTPVGIAPRRGWHGLQEIERGEAPPLVVTGVAHKSRHRPPNVACFAGAASGADECAEVLEWAPEGLHCAAFSPMAGDAGAPVYTVPNHRGTVQALGTLVGLAVDETEHGFAGCYVPLSASIKKLRLRW